LAEGSAAREGAPGQEMMSPEEEVLFQQVQALAQSLSGLGASAFNWSAGLSLLLRQDLAELILEYCKPCAHLDVSLAGVCSTLEGIKWEEARRLLADASASAGGRQESQQRQQHKTIGRVPLAPALAPKRQDPGTVMPRQNNANGDFLARSWQHSPSAAAQGKSHGSPARTGANASVRPRPRRSLPVAEPQSPQSPQSPHAGDTLRPTPQLRRVWKGASEGLRSPKASQPLDRIPRARADEVEQSKDEVPKKTKDRTPSPRSSKSSGSSAEDEVRDQDDALETEEEDASGGDPDGDSDDGNRSDSNQSRA